MDPLLGFLGLIGLGFNLIRGWQAAGELARQQALMEQKLDAQLRAAIDAVNRAAAFANKDISKDLAPVFSQLQGRVLSQLAGQAAASGLTGSGLAIGAEQDVRSSIAAQLGERIADWEMRKMMPLLEAQGDLARILGGQAGMHASMLSEFGRTASSGMSWLPIAIQSGLFNLDFGNLFGGLFGTPKAPSVPGGIPGRPGDFIPPRVV